MHHWMKGLLWALACVVGSVFVLFAWGRFRPPSSEQAGALALLQQDLKPAQGRNAFPWLWFVDIAVPDDRMDEVYAADRARLLAGFAIMAPGKSELPTAQAPFPRLASLSAADRSLLCKADEADCLGKVRSHRDEVAGLLERHAERLRRDRALSDSAYAWDDLLERGPLAIPAYAASSGLWQTAIAADFIDGRPAQALASACTQVATMRRLHAHSNTLIGTMVFAARLRGAVHLFTQLLASSTAGAPMPASCAAAFAPTTVEDVDLCPAMQGEFAFVASPVLFGEPQHWYEHWKLSIRNTRRMLAVSYGAVCEASRSAPMLADERLNLQLQPPPWDIFDLVSNSIGTILSRMSAPAFEAYLVRQQDTAATLRIGALMLWLNEHRDGSMPLPQRLALRPAWIHFADDRQLSVNADGHELTLRARGNEGKAWMTDWPLPAGY
ncbi:hypothetical protein ISN76_18835 [Dyella halodurans]|uniref:Uncharacterized protein n=1 Tax=Dyella halodurans TaxID=1920171 RepID=A0ABV9C7S1_9GAMM|nr:hypothetical protein [Dyella halodurans]